VTGPIIPPGAPGIPAAVTPRPPIPGGGGAPSPAGGAAPPMPGGSTPKIPDDIAAHIDNLPPGAEAAAKFGQTPLGAAVGSVVLTSAAGTPVSPEHVMMASEVGENAIQKRKQEKSQENENQSQNAPRP
jgi:hypothetical protein